MVEKDKIKQNEINLMRRYLIWCYKDIKEELDKVDRYYTQKVVDDFIVEELKKEKSFKDNKEYQKLVGGFEAYIVKKVEKANEKKFIKESEGSVVKSKYVYLKNRLSAVERAIIHFLGVKELERIVGLYEEEMTQRILESREHT